MTFLANLVYFLLSLVIGGLLIILSIIDTSVIDISGFLAVINSDIYIKLAMTLSGILILLLYINQLQQQLLKNQREKTIVFERPLGEVTITLAALEDVIKKLLFTIPEIKETRPQITANKRGIFIVLKTSLSSETNIPDVTSKIQTLVRDKLQQILDIEEDINIKIAIRKIIYKEERKTPKETKEKDIENPTIPYRDFR